MRIYKHENIDKENWEDEILNPRVDENIENENIDELECPIKPTMSKAMECLKILAEYAIYNDLENAMDPISKLQQILISKNVHSMKSTTLDQFFNKERMLFFFYRCETSIIDFFMKTCQ